MAKVYVKFPKTGLGNMLLVWANAAVFAHLNKLPLYTSTWWGFHWGAIFRGEQKKRFYAGYFVETSLADLLLIWVGLHTKKVLRNPALFTLDSSYRQLHELYLFDKLLTHERMFINLSKHKDFISRSLYQMLQEHHKYSLNKLEAPAMSVHVRRGDFKTTNQATSMSFFVEGIRAVRAAIGTNIPVTVFSDADENELFELFKLPEIKMTTKKADILDILLMSKSRIMILSQSSSFSYWAAFLSDALVILKHDDWQERIKEDSLNYCELRFHHEDNASIQNLIQKVKANLHEKGN